ncbi:major facilitator superfamily domain-containing protein [Ilyonectria destructans]|nr:major facilitator superfamily domain-containing protein [Ilyonectria destructans]
MPATPGIITDGDAIEDQRADSDVTAVSYLSLPHKPQLFLLMLIRMTESLTASSIQSYLYFQLQHFDPSASPATISAQAGIIIGAKTAAHVCTGLIWGRLADWEYCGRKTVIVFGLLASSVSILGYGFSQTFAMALTWQLLEGVLNSTVSMARCVIAELNPQKRHRARALTLLPLCTNAGSLIGPLIGGFLVFPGRENGNSGFLSKFPYAAPNIVIAAFHAILAVATIAVVEETLPRSEHSHLGIFRRAWTRLGPRRVSDRTSHDEVVDESTSLLGNQGFQTPADSQSVASPQGSELTRLKFSQIWTFNVVATMAAYFLIHGHTGSFPSLWAIFLSTPAPSAKQQGLSFRLYGGLGMNPRGVGTVMSMQGAIGVITQVVLYPTLNDWLGTLRLFRTGLLVFPFTYFIAPFPALVNYYATNRPSNAAPYAITEPCVWISVALVLLLYVCGRTGVAPATTLLINDSTPHPSARATIHTTGTIVSSLSRSIFPPIALGMFAYGLRIGFVELGFWFLAGVATLACLASMWVVEGDNGNQA